MRKASRVTLTSCSLFRASRNVSSSVMSASSWFVTCGIKAEFLCSPGPAIFWIRVSGLVSTAPNFAKSTLGQGASARPAPAGTPAAAAAGATAPLITDFTYL